MATTRAKFRCHSITLVRTSAQKPGVQYKHRDNRGYIYEDEQGNEITHDEAYHTFDQPTVKLGAVADGSEENKAFFSATPSANLEMTISNPAAAETFELGEFYYVDFTPAPA